MLRHQELRILQYNVWKSRDVVLAASSRIPESLITLAIQEPWRNPFIETSYHTLKAHFQLTYLQLYNCLSYDPAGLSFQV